MPPVLLREVYAGRVKGGRGQGHRGPGTKGPGEGGTRGQGRASRQGAGQGQGARAQRGGKRGSAATRIAPHCARAGRRAEGQRRQGREEGVPRRHEGASVGRKHKGAPQPSEPPAVRGGTGQGGAPRRAAARRSTPMGAVSCVELYNKGQVRACDVRATCLHGVLRSVLRNEERGKGRAGREVRACDMRATCQQSVLRSVKK